MRLKYFVGLMAAAICAFAVAASTASATPVLVKMRIEGATRTIFEGPILVEGRTVTTESGGTHKCNGTNDGANPEPVPVPTAALADASEIGKFTFDGEWFPEFEDFFITRIAETSQTETEFWGILVNYELIPVGGCQFGLHNGDEVLYAFNAFNAEHFLRLKGPHAATVGHPITVKVTEGATGAPIAGAIVDGATTNSSGEASITFTHPGVEHLKAAKAGSVRSNGLVVVVV
jgi:hypothetical protein